MHNRVCTDAQAPSVKPYRISTTPDRELEELQDYLVRLANFGLASYEELGGHKNWKKLLQGQKKRNG